MLIVRGNQEAITTESIEILTNTGAASFEIVGTKSFGEIISVDLIENDPEGVVNDYKYTLKSSSLEGQYSGVVAEDDNNFVSKVYPDTPNFDNFSTYAVWISPSGDEQFVTTFYGENSGNFIGELFLSKYAENGVWTLDSFYMLDYAGNQSVLSTDELIELGIETNFLVTGSQADTTAPQLVSYELPSYSIDLSDPQISENNFVDSSSLSNEEWIIAEIIDNESGVVAEDDYLFVAKVYPDTPNFDNFSTYAVWISPSGDEQFVTTFYGENSGNFIGELFLSKYAENGVWTLDSFYMLDYAGNQSVLSTDELIELGIETNFLVTGSQADTTAPQLVSYELPSYSIDLSDPQISENNFVDSSSLSNEEWIIAEIIDNESGVVAEDDNNFVSKVYPDTPNFDNFSTYALWVSPSGDEQFVTTFYGEDSGNFIGEYFIQICRKWYLDFR